MTVCFSFYLLREMGHEPTRAYTHKILSLACLPIPALPQVEYRIPTLCNISNMREKVNLFLQYFGQGTVSCPVSKIKAETIEKSNVSAFYL